MKTRCLFWAAALLLPFIFSCEKEPAGPNANGSGVTINASLENGRNWNDGDFVLINGVQYQITENTGTPSTTISNVAESEIYSGVYDYGEGIVSDNILSLELPQQIGLDKGQVIPMVASSVNQELNFKHLLGFVRLKISGEAVLKKITLTSTNADQKLSGKAEADLEFLKNPIILMSDEGSQTISMDLGEKGLSLAGGEKEVILPIPPAKYEEGFKLMIYDGEGKVMTEQIDFSVVVTRGETADLPAINYTPGSDAPVPMECTLEADAHGNASKWATGATICVNSDPYFIQSGEGASKAVFGPVVNSDSYLIVAPEKAHNSSAKDFAIINLPKDQSVSAPLTERNPSVAYTTGNSAELKYVAGVVSFKVSGENIIKNIQFISKDKSKDIAGKMNIEFTGNEFTSEMNQGGASTIMLNCGGGVSTSGGRVFDIVVPAGEYTQGFKIIFTNNRNQMHVVETEAVTVARNAAANLPDIAWQPSADDAGNLSTFGWANCYVVSSKGKYSFETKMVDGTTIKNISKVDWLWANSVKGDAKSLISGIEYKEGVVSFEAGEAEGNVLLAAFDASNEIIWSWHIWLTDTPKTINMENMIPKDPTRGFFLMDRNLGAVSPNEADGEETYGFFYQWGRKDPFYGGTKEELVNTDGDITSKEPFKNAITGTVCNEAYTQAKWQVAEVSPEVGTLEFATKNPMFFIYGTTARTEAGDNNWLTKDSPLRKYYYAEDSPMWNPFHKTNYDPCPPGYKVPRQGTWDELGTNRGKWNSSFSGFNFTSTSGESTWFPAQGMRLAHPDEGGALYRLDSGIKNWIGLWTSDLSTGGTSCSSISLNISTTETNTQASTDPWANGLNVRCVKNYEY